MKTLSRDCASALAHVFADAFQEARGTHPDHDDAGVLMGVLAQAEAALEKAKRKRELAETMLEMARDDEVTAGRVLRATKEQLSREANVKRTAKRLLETMHEAAASDEDAGAIAKKLRRVLAEGMDGPGAKGGKPAVADDEAVELVDLVENGEGQEGSKSIEPQ